MAVGAGAITAMTAREVIVTLIFIQPHPKFQLPAFHHAWLPTFFGYISAELQYPS